MKKIMSALLASAIVATSAVTFSAPAAADPRRDRYVEQYYHQNGRDDDYWKWKKNRNRWDDQKYNSWYRDRHRNRNNNDAAVAGLFGFAAGAILGGALSQGASSSVYDANDRYCAQRYRSYDPVSNTFMGYDGRRHSCP